MLMPISSGRTVSVAAVALLTSLMAALWILMKPTFISGSTYTVFVAITIATAAIAINAWQNAQATTSTSHVIHDAEIAGPVTKTR